VINERRLKKTSRSRLPELDQSTLWVRGPAAGGNWLVEAVTEVHFDARRCFTHFVTNEVTSHYENLVRKRQISIDGAMSVTIVGAPARARSCLGVFLGSIDFLSQGTSFA